MNWHIECKLSGIGVFFKGTLDEAIAKAKALIDGADFSVMVVWGGKDMAERFAEVGNGRTWIKDLRVK